MKVLTISLALLACVVATTASPLNELEDNNLKDFFGNIINNTINNVLKNLTDPLAVSDINLTFDQTGKLEGKVSATGISVRGVKQLVATSIDVDVLQLALNMEIQIPSISLKFNYDLNVLVLDIVPLYGAGLNNIDLGGVKLNVTGKVSITGTKIHLKDLGVLLNVDSATFNLNGLLNNAEFSALVNTALNDNFVSFVNNNNKLLSKLLGAALEAIINGALGLEEVNFEQ